MLDKKRIWGFHPTKSSARPRGIPWKRLSQALSYLILSGWTLFVIWAVGWIALGSLSNTRSIFSNTILQGQLHFENYSKILVAHNVGQYFLNTIIYVGEASLLILLVGAPASYALSRFDFRGRSFIRLLFITGIGMPGIMIPLFGIFTRLQLIGTLSGLILVYVGTLTPFTIYFLTAFFSSLPKEIEESARIDGCSEIQAFWHIMLPLARPGLLVVTIFNAVTLWNDYFWALIFVNSTNARTLSLGMAAIVQGMRFNSGDWGGMFAGVIIIFLPTFVLYVFLSEKIINGITMGALKS